MNTPQYEHMSAIRMRNHLLENWKTADEWRTMLHDHNGQACFVQFAYEQGLSSAVGADAYRALVYPFGKKKALNLLNKKIWRHKRGRQVRTLVKIMVSAKMWARRNRRVDTTVGLPPVPVRGHVSSDA